MSECFGCGRYDCDGNCGRDPLTELDTDELLDLRAALTVVIDRYGKLPSDEGSVGDAEYVARWQALAERIDKLTDEEQA